MARKPFQAELIQFVFDASALINIEQSGQMDRLRTFKGGVLISEKVAEEVNQRGKPLRRFISRYPEVVSPFVDIQEEHDYLRFRRQPVIHEGEASAMAIALNRNKCLVIDEKETKATGKAREHGIATMSSQEFIKRHF